ncbi:MAG: prephenate dehydrogenase [Bacteroidetes bacterium]|nr:prephenate dehydrogenase [Bacteroidota bacterium]
MRILIMGAGKMGTWLADALCRQHNLAILDKDIEKLKFVFNTERLTTFDQVTAFRPDLLINAVNLKNTIPAFKEILPYLPKSCIISDIASVKNGIQKYYNECGFRFTSTHPMFGPTFSRLMDLSSQHAIIIEESDEIGKLFFKDFYNSLNLTIHEYSFKGHDKTIAYSLATPFSSTIVFAACMKKQEAPGTTFKKHLSIAEGLFSEDNYLISEILFAPHSTQQLEKIKNELMNLLDIIGDKDSKKLHQYLNNIKSNLNMPSLIHNE